MGRKIRTCTVRKDIKALDKPANITNKIRRSYVRTKDRMESTVKSTERTAKVAREAVKISSQTADISVKAIIASTRLLSTVLSMESQQMRAAWGNPRRGGIPVELVSSQPPD